MIGSNLRGYALRIAIVIAALVVMAGGAGAAMLTVDDSGGADYARIQDAIDNANVGDKIFVHNGTYIESIRITKNNLSIIGEDKNTTIIHGGWSADLVVDIQANNVYFSGFSVTNSSESGTGVYLQDTNNFTFINNMVKYTYQGLVLISSNHTLVESNNISGREYGSYIYFSSSSNNSFLKNSGTPNVQISDYSNDNKFEDNSLESISIGNSNENIIRSNEVQRLNIHGSNRNIIDGNNFSGEYGGWIDIYSSNNNMVINNTFPSNYRWSGLSLYASSNNSIYDNNITGGNYGINLRSNSKNNTISRNIVQSASEYSIYILYSSSNTVYLNTFNSPKNAYDYNGFNSWENGTVGNYWSDYSGQDNDSNGIGDTPYLKIETNADAKDNYPLITPPCNCTLLLLPMPVAGGAVVSIGNATIPQNSSIALPIMVENVTNLAAATIKLTYDPNIVNVLNISAGDLGGSTNNGGGWSYSIKNIIGEAIISAYSNAGKSGNLTFANLLLRAVGPINATSPLTLSVNTLSNENGKAIPFTIRNGNFTISALVKGDVNSDSNVSIADALFIAQYTVGLRTLSSQQLAAADVNNDGQVTIVDALFIAQYTVGLRQL